ncbi:LOW QUALITY PROTEIN: Protein of unknown function [Gryllus bimaculatus]|nr:LOW QUALITY PROTEIN: Protein of unknown function [Gryllus bimaculatus]
MSSSASRASSAARLRRIELGTSDILVGRLPSLYACYCMPAPSRISVLRSPRAARAPGFRGTSGCRRRAPPSPHVCKWIVVCALFTELNGKVAKTRLTRIARRSPRTRSRVEQVSDPAVAAAASAPDITTPTAASGGLADDAPTPSHVTVTVTTAVTAAITAAVTTDVITAVTAAVTSAVTAVPTAAADPLTSSPP